MFCFQSTQQLYWGLEVVCHLNNILSVSRLQWLNTSSAGVMSHMWTLVRHRAPGLAVWVSLMWHSSSNNSRLEGNKQYQVPVWTTMFKVCRKGPAALVMSLGVRDWIPLCGQIQLECPNVSSVYPFPKCPLISCLISKPLALSCRLLFIPVLAWYFNFPKSCLEQVLSIVTTDGRDQHSFLALSSLMPLLLPPSCHLWLYGLLRLWGDQTLPTPVHWQLNGCHSHVPAILTFF